MHVEPKKNGKYDWNELNIETYNKHVKDTPEYENYAKGRKKPVSELTVLFEETNELLKKYGIKRFSRHQAYFKATYYIGYWVDNKGKRHPTKKGRISYSKKGAHITPMMPDNYVKGGYHGSK
ncbi:polymorphic toxin type 50 domain-containing protein [Lactobacillus sp. ESL0703]|uniref:polymorphic toxin type 50 domain-containing protein n=1 Tax=Lactobacillus sp. ESL0703 TaxID=2983218 RepID=UPI0023F779EF|nr:polymorphic toxin type 50 domain-containing protein [Lactobacillus sp. ESL0703]